MQILNEERKLFFYFNLAYKYVVYSRIYINIYL